MIHYGGARTPKSPIQSGWGLGGVFANALTEDEPGDLKEERTAITAPVLLISVREKSSFVHILFGP